MWHTYTMLKTAQAVAKIYSDRLIDKELLYSGVILHDMGKIVEIKSFLVNERTLAGKVMGHISIMSALLNQICEKLDVDKLNVVLLQHLILSSHGKLEYGSPVVPVLLEAEILSMLDNLDARIYQVDRHIKEISVGSETKRIATCEGRVYLKHFEKTPSDRHISQKVLII